MLFLVNTMNILVLVLMCAQVAITHFLHQNRNIILVVDGLPFPRLLKKVL
ncbi:UNVERIFIED_CONTAM: hypothetical protein GTU68_019787 [Idotea baltica]|nr:hypothetical protein [Idotea baltica]